MKAIRARLTYANVVATLALLLAVGGASALAASQLAKNSVGTKQLKKNAVTGEKVKDGSLSGADIGGAVASAEKAATAGRATTAATADHAATAQVADGATTAGRAEIAKLAEGALHASNADTLGGSPASAFQPNGSVRRVDWAPTGCALECNVELWSIDGVTMRGSCSGIGSTRAGFILAAVPGGSAISIFGAENSTLFAQRPPATAFTLPFAMEGAGEKEFEGQMMIRTPARTQTLLFTLVKSTNGSSCTLAGTLLST
ncbi:MAG: hypothetical protein ACOYD4_08260 [Solirubrobacterales bacterium]